MGQLQAARILRRELSRLFDGVFAYKIDNAINKASQSANNTSWTIEQHYSREHPLYGTKVVFHHKTHYKLIDYAK